MLPSLNVEAAARVDEDPVPNVQGLDEAMAALDADGDGFLDAEELHKLLLPNAPTMTIEQAEELYKNLLSHIDANGDGQISISEIKDYWKSKGGDVRSGSVQSQLAGAVLTDMRSKISDLFKELSDRVTTPAASPVGDVEKAETAASAPAEEAAAAVPAAEAVAAVPAAEAVEVVVESPPKSLQPQEPITAPPPETPAAKQETPAAPPVEPARSASPPATQPPATQPPASEAATQGAPKAGALASAAPTLPPPKKKRPNSVDSWKELENMPQEQTPFAKKCLFITFFGGCAAALVGGVVVGSIFYFGSNPPL